MAVWRTSNKKNAPNGHYNLQLAAMHDRIAQQEGQRGSKGTLWPDFHG
jgi:hypothetical protein